MKTDASRPNDDQERRSHWLWILGAGCILVVLIALFQRALNSEQSTRSIITQTPEHVTTSSRWRAEWRLPPRRSSVMSAPTAEEIVAGKVVQFGKNRRKLVHAMAKHLKVEVPDDGERFFDAVERGRWEEIDAAYRALLLSDDSLNQPRSAELHQIWRPIQETWGAAREAHTWPAEKLLDYSEAVLSSLRPGMIYAGGTDPAASFPPCSTIPATASAALFLPKTRSPITPI